LIVECCALDGIRALAQDRPVASVVGQGASPLSAKWRFASWVFAALAACSGEAAPARSKERSSSLIHLADRLEDARVQSAEERAELADRSWTFDEPRPQWTAFSSKENPHLAGVALEQLSDGVRISLSEAGPRRGPFLIGGMVLSDPDLGPPRRLGG
jgi:hypothetical protein